MGDSFVGIQARLMSQALRKLTGAVSRSNTSLVFTNQLREKIGVMFGNPETTPGGRALKFYASVRLDIRRVETIKNGQESVGNRVRVKVVKNKVAPPSASPSRLCTARRLRRAASSTSGSRGDVDKTVRGSRSRRRGSARVARRRGLPAPEPPIATEIESRSDPSFRRGIAVLSKLAESILGDMLPA